VRKLENGLPIASGKLGKQFSVAEEKINMYPTATYRLQLHHQFTLSQLKSILDYLEQLGTDTIYASPIFSSVPGSLHGYDVTNPHILNPEIGTESQFKEIADQLRQKKMKWLQDIVPNHMAFDSKNEWLMDVLERGEASEFADFFDINWKHPKKELSKKLMVPFLGEELNDCLEKKDIQLVFNEVGFSIKYFDAEWPVSVSSLGILLTVMRESISPIHQKQEIEVFSKQLNEINELALAGIGIQEWKVAKAKWIVDILNHSSLKKILQEAVRKINGNRGLMEEILDRQYYILTYWRSTEKEINYRRFFTVNGLICLRMEDEKVFQKYHQYILELRQEGYFDGFRIDHIDGLYDPRVYLEQLRREVGADCYIIAEKILAPNEDFPSNWNSQGTSGYEFLSHVSRLLTNVEGARKLEIYYKDQIASRKAYEDIVFEKKLFILLHHMKGELDNLISYLQELKLWPHEKQEDYKMFDALAIFMAAFPIYRIYPDAFPLDQVEYADKAFQSASQRKPERLKELKWIRSLFDAKTMMNEVSPELLFLKRLMQFTGPLAAKGVEDTAFYFYNPLISHNEVGDAPGKLAISSSAFHTRMIKRLEKTPYSLNATSTHDTKRGEDARARINLLSEIPEEWIRVVEEWRVINLDQKKKVNGRLAPADNQEYFIYQSMIGGFPPDLQIREDDRSRLKEYVQKFLREEKLYTDWTEPDEAYEQACFEFIDGLFDKKNRFLEFFLPFVEKVIAIGSIYSLSQALIKVTAPGIPDIYQGSELWDLSYVDPDNRRPVDYELRSQILQQIKSKESDKKKLLCFLANHRSEGFEKIYVLYKSLQFRKKHPELFWHGEYIPLLVDRGDDTVLVYARRWNNQWAIVAVPMNISNKMRSHDRVPKNEAWNALSLVLPPNAPAKWINLFTGQHFSTDELNLSEIFSEFPVAVLIPLESE